METVAQIVGVAIKRCRKKRGISQVELAERINKSKSTLSKYETGEISIDITTLSEISNVLDVPLSYFGDVVSQKQNNRSTKITGDNIPTIFGNGLTYMYNYDGRDKTVCSSVIALGEAMDNMPNYYNASMFYNVKDISEYFYCENVYSGHVEFHHVLTGVYMIHKNTDLEHVSIIIPENFMQRTQMWGLFTGVSFRPIQPVALKVLLSSTPIKLTNDVIASLKIQPSEIQQFRKNNFFSAKQSF